jgi:hypothetical protein
MFIPFDQLPETARIWIYQAARQLSISEETVVSSRLRIFINNWTAHGRPMRASFTIVHGRFIVLAADESVQPASGCSIDESVRFIRALDNEFLLQLFVRTSVTFYENDIPVPVPVSSLQTLLIENKWNANSLVFDVTVNTVGDFKNRFVMPAGKTWLKKYLHKVEA